MNYVRGIAHRVFAGELNESTFRIQEGSNEYAPKFLITPTGAKCNRVFFVGKLIEKKSLGNESLLWNARISDPSGILYVYAGHNQPEPAKVLAKTALLEYIAVIGKPSTYTTKVGNMITSIWAESIQVVDEATKDRWVMDTAKHTITRLLKLQGNDLDAVMVRDQYSTINIDYYRSMVKNALMTLKTVDNSIIQKIEQCPKLSINSIDINESKQKTKCIKIDAYDYDEEWEMDGECRETIQDIAGDYDILKYRCMEESDPEE